MKKLLLIPFLLFACTKEITYVNKSGNIVTQEFKTKEIKAETLVIDEVKKISQNKSTDSCETPGVCCKCGLTFEMQHECSCGFWRNCPGRQDVVFDMVEETYHIEYRFENRTLHSPKSSRTKRNVISRGNCG